MYTSPFDHKLALLKSREPAMRYDGKESFEEYRKRACEKLYDVLGLPLERCDDSMTVEYETEWDDYTETRFSFQSEPGYTIPAHLCVLKGKEGPQPLFICLQGHGTGQHISLGRVKYEGDDTFITSGDRDLGVRAMKQGYSVLTFDMRNFGEVGGNPGPQCYFSSRLAIKMGRCTTGEKVWDVQRAIDVLEKYFSDKIDMNRIYLHGHSSGGMITLYATALEPRIKACMASGAFSSFEAMCGKLKDGCDIVPNILKYFNMGDVAGLIAPRPTVITLGDADDVCPMYGAIEQFPLVKRAFEGAGAPDNVTFLQMTGGHRFYSDSAWPVMLGYLKG